MTTDEILSRLNPSSDGPTFSSEETSFHEPNTAEDNKENAAVVSGSGKTSIAFVVEDEGEKDATGSRDVQFSAETEETQTTKDASQLSTDQPADSTAPTDLAASQTLVSSQESVPSTQKKTTGYLANRRSASFVNASDEMTLTSTVEPIIHGVKLGYLSNRRSASFIQCSGDEENAQPGNVDERTLKRSNSMLRLSMTWDGKAKVVGNNSPTPSPPRMQPPMASFPLLGLPTSTLRRSHSAVGLGNNPKNADLDAVGRKFQRTASGRSHDSRAWEFWCDSEARNSLAEKAEQESSGSAADAIGLMRSNSRTAAAKANANKKRALQPSGSSNAPSKRSKFSRATTATGRLQSETRKPVKGKEGKGEGEEFERPFTDSDKENWEPTNSGLQSRRAPSKSNVASRRAVLGENNSVPSQTASLGAMMAKERRLKIQTDDDENERPSVDDEVSSFMCSSERSGSARSSLSSGEDFDCVQGLLSLSQGIWN